MHRAPAIRAKAEPIQTDHAERPMLCLGISNIVFGPNDFTAAAITSQMVDFTHRSSVSSFVFVGLGVSSLNKPSRSNPWQVIVITSGSSKVVSGSGSGIGSAISSAGGTGLIGAQTVVCSTILHQADDRLAQLSVANAHERPG